MLRSGRYRHQCLSESFVLADIDVNICQKAPFWQSSTSTPLKKHRFGRERYRSHFIFNDLAKNCSFPAVFGGMSDVLGECPWDVPEGLRKLAGGKTAPAVAAPGNGLRMVSVLSGRRNESVQQTSAAPPGRSLMRVVPGATPAACPRLISLAPSEPGKGPFTSRPMPPKTAGNQTAHFHSQKTNTQQI